MPINNQYNDSSRHFFAQCLCLVLLCLIMLLPSCAEGDAPSPDSTGGDDGLCEVTLRLDVASFAQAGGGGVNARSYVTGNSDENRIHDIWLFQYNAVTGESLKTPVYLDNFDSNNIQVDLTFNDDGNTSVVCVVANTKNKDWALDENDQIKEGFDTYAKLLQQVLPDAVTGAFMSSNMGADGDAIPMFGVSDAMAIVSKCYVSIPLIRMFARVRVYVDPAYPHELGMEVENIMLGNIPFYCRVGSVAPAGGDAQAAAYPETVEWRSFDAGDANEITLYIPENLQGKVSGMSSKQLATEGFPDKALVAKVEMSYGDATAPKTHVYTVYPGLDMKNDFNIKRNHIYNVNIKFTKLPE